MIEPLIKVYTETGVFTPTGSLASECYRIWGDIQMEVVVEELAELIEALEMTRIYAYKPEFVRHVAEEVADVELVLAQLVVILDYESKAKFSQYLDEERADPDRHGVSKDGVLSLARLIHALQKRKRKNSDNLDQIAMLFVDLEVALQHLQIYTDEYTLESWCMQTFQRYLDEYRQGKRDRIRGRLDMAHKAKIMKWLSPDEYSGGFVLTLGFLLKEYYPHADTVVRVVSELVRDGLVEERVQDNGAVLVMALRRDD
ncbi:hypothetical protein [Bacteroides sp.]|uniref:hypothetical protein n=1 Tax=Bacteroides sp. TaxID=29523 RepID=UPI00262D8503|nr:hypothetical protein [Bacteroides sp.]MDD3039037.1 hypothetical protein [Bacteroides sp.]